MMMLAFLFVICSLNIIMSFKSPRIQLKQTIHSQEGSQTKLFRKIYHNDDGTFDVTTAPKLDFNENYYRVLEVDSNCAQKTLKKQFLKMIFKYHPDRIPLDDPDTELKLVRNQQTMVINCAYKGLKDDELRATYDQKNREPIRVSSSTLGGFGAKKAVNLSAEEIEQKRQDKMIEDELKKAKKEEEKKKSAEKKGSSEKKKMAEMKKNSDLKKEKKNQQMEETKERRAAEQIRNEQKTSDTS
jgi:curved DNA-binding protein CbpA